MVTRAGLVWNRACLAQGGAQRREGDAALSAMLLFHGLAMNGGVTHAVECLTPEELDASTRGYLFYGLGAISQLVAAAKATPSDDDEADELERRLDAEYAAKISDGDATLIRLFEEHYAAHPEQYSTVD
jgi:hypothetical protein